MNNMNDSKFVMKNVGFISVCLCSGEMIQQKIQHRRQQNSHKNITAKTLTGKSVTTNSTFQSQEGSLNKSQPTGIESIQAYFSSKLDKFVDLSYIDWRLVRNVTIAGMCGNGAVCCLWYNHIFDRLVKPGFTWKILAKRVAVDNCIAGGSCLVVFYACE